MPKKVSQFARYEQPIHWSRAVICGIWASAMMMAFMDIFYMLGTSHFSLELYLGSLIRGTVQYAPRNWIVGVFANWLVGAIFGILYAVAFESYLYRANSRVGAYLGFAHAVLAALVVFPFFGMVRQQMDLPIYEHFGILGSSIDAATPILLFTAHIMFGVTMGTFYGPVRTRRARARNFEPGELGFQGEPDVITHIEDPTDQPDFRF